ncbi:MAG: hypothetical protein JWQ74_855 [Marmoricola sp.]|nr:hypothetical protein [Marmoricola sp.]
MDEHLCASCGASLPPTGTYCLACDTPVADPDRADLSIGSTQVTRVGRRWVAVATVTAVAAGAVGIPLAVVFGGRAYAGHQRDQGADDAARAAVHMILRAEGGSRKACDATPALLTGNRVREHRACLAVVGDDPGVTLRSHELAAVATHRTGTLGTVELRGTLTDGSGTHPFDDTIAVRQRHSDWRATWNGAPVALE